MLDTPGSRFTQAASRSSTSSRAKRSAVSRSGAVIKTTRGASMRWGREPGEGGWIEGALRDAGEARSRIASRTRPCSCARRGPERVLRRAGGGATRVRSPPTMSLLAQAVLGVLPHVPKPVMRVFARNYIAGETLPEALAKLEELTRRGYSGIL